MYSLDWAATTPDEAFGLPFAPSRTAKRCDYNLLPSYKSRDQI